MRVEISGAQITDAVVEVIEDLQSQPDLAKLYTDTIDAATRMVITDLAGDEARDSAAFALLRTLQMIRRDIIKLSMPPDVDDPANDAPAASI